MFDPPLRLAYTIQMKNHLHKHLNLAPNDIIGIFADGDAFVFLADDENYSNYLNDMNYDYYGSEVTESPFYMAAPWPGEWHIVVEQADPADSIDVRIEVQKYGH